MASAMLAARATGAATSSWNALALAALVVAFALPFSVAGESFALSFACVGAIFAMTPLLERAFERFSLPHRLQETIVLTIATQLGTWPLTAAIFLQFSPYAIVANAAVVPLVPVTMILGALQLAASPLAAFAQACANLNAWVLAWMLGVVRLVSSLPYATIVMTPAPNVVILAYEAVLLAVSPLIRRGATTLALAAILMATSFVLCPLEIPDRRLEITVLDVGQADSIVIRTPSGHAILVDGGGRLERGSSTVSNAEQIGERIVVPFLLRHGIHTLDAIVLSHPHGDHVGGCRPVVEALRVAVIADSGQTYGGHAYHDCLTTAVTHHVTVVRPRAGVVWRTNDGATLTFIGPSLPFISGKNAINDNSVAFILQYRSFRMFFTGDAGVAAERHFLDERFTLHADVLKVGHHGSAYSSSPDFIAAVHPHYAIISVGRHNMFGHPASSTIKTLTAEGAVIYRTDEDAAVIVTTDGVTSRVRSYFGCCAR
jgi:competence protein ComEC